MQALVTLLWIVAIVLIFWLLLIRPAQRRQKDMAKLQSELSLGDQVMLTSGVYGRVAEAADDHVMVEVAPGVVIKVARGAVGAIVREEPVEEAATEPVETDEER